MRNRINSLYFASTLAITGVSCARELPLIETFPAEFHSIHFVQRFEEAGSGPCSARNKRKARDAGGFATCAGMKVCCPWHPTAPGLLRRNPEVSWRVPQSAFFLDPSQFITTVAIHDRHSLRRGIWHFLTAKL
jgi:hypothetical protein